MTHSNQIAGIDLGDAHSQVCIIDAEDGRVVEEMKLRTSQAAFEAFFSVCTGLRVALETGTHSPWASRVVAGCGHEVIVANARQVRLVHVSTSLPVLPIKRDASRSVRHVNRVNRELAARARHHRRGLVKLFVYGAWVTV